MHANHSSVSYKRQLSRLKLGGYIIESELTSHLEPELTEASAGPVAAKIWIEKPALTHYLVEQ